MSVVMCGDHVIDSSRDHDIIPTNRSKLIYIEIKVQRKTLQHLKAYLQLNSITPFATIENLFNYFKDIFDNLY